MAKQDYAHYAEMDLRRAAAARDNQTQTRTEGLMKRSSDFDQMVLDPFTQMSTNPEGTRVHRCVQKLKGKKGVNAYAVCQKSTGQSYATGKKL